MPDLTITLGDDELAQLTELGAGLSLTTKRLAERIIHRSLSSTTGSARRSNAQRTAERARRQLEIARLLSRRKHATLSMVEREELAKKFGTSVRTISRDLDVATVAIGRADEPRRRRRRPRRQATEQPALPLSTVAS